MTKKGEFLKDRAERFLKNAFELFQKEEYDLSAFNLEQAVQLWIKYLLWVKIGDWPKTHYLSELVETLAKTYESEEILKFYQERELFFDDLSDAYFTSRYYPREYTKNSVSQLIKNTKEFLELTVKITGEKLNV